MSWMTAVASVPDAASVSAPLRMPAGLTLVTAALADRNCSSMNLVIPLASVSRASTSALGLLKRASSSVMPTISAHLAKVMLTVSNAKRTDRLCATFPDPLDCNHARLSRDARVKRHPPQPWMRPITLIGHSRLTNSLTTFCA